MSARQPLVAGNWKLNGTTASAAALAGALAEATGDDAFACECVVCPVLVHLDVVREAVAGSGIRVGAQNCSDEASGAFTGEVAAGMLVEAGCSHVVVGHSERRAHYGESSEFVARKALAAQAAGLTPILCVGETLDEREAGKVDAVVGEQLDALLTLGGVAAFEQLVVAYEPVWAIGTGKTATPAEAQAVHGMIRERVGKHDPDVAGKLRILYGGSVKPDNAAILFGQADIDGGLIGGASLDADAFVSICRAAA